MDFNEQRRITLRYIARQPSPESQAPPPTGMSQGDDAAILLGVSESFGQTASGLAADIDTKEVMAQDPPGMSIFNAGDDQNSFF